jgi:hypothetical protein
MLEMSDAQVGEEVGSWERAGLKASADRGGSMSSLTLESSDGARASLVGIGVRYDPVSQKLMLPLRLARWLSCGAASISAGRRSRRR